jgi:hypothetical protein
MLTLMEHITQGTIIQNHDLAQVWLNGAQVLDESAMSVGTMLAVISTRKEFALLF